MALPLLLELDDEFFLGPVVLSGHHVRTVNGKDLSVKYKAVDDQSMKCFPLGLVRWRFVWIGTITSSYTAMTLEVFFVCFSLLLTSELFVFFQKTFESNDQIVEWSWNNSPYGKRAKNPSARIVAFPLLRPLPMRSRL